MKHSALAFGILVLCACQTLSGAHVESITLPNGRPGLVVDCSVGGISACFKSAGRLCKNGYLIHERTSDKDVKSKIPVNGLEKEGSIVEEHEPYRQLKMKEQYMVISCKE